MVTRYTVCVMLALVSALWCGCSQQTVQSADKDISHNINTAGQEVKKIGAEAKPQLDKLDLGARVTAALRANANLPDSIRVDADTNGVRLRGTVRNPRQKALAGKIAQQTLPEGKVVSNQLAVKAS
jgi:osmotically-inducible protein OsmY